MTILRKSASCEWQWVDSTAWCCSAQSPLVTWQLISRAESFSGRIQNWRRSSTAIWQVNPLSVIRFKGGNIASVAMGTTFFQVVVTKASEAYYRSLSGFSYGPQISNCWFPVSKQGLVGTVSLKFTGSTRALIFVVVFLVETFGTILWGKKTIVFSFPIEKAFSPSWCEIHEAE